MRAILFLVKYSGMKGFSNIAHEKKIYQSRPGKTSDAKSPPSMMVQNWIYDVSTRHVSLDDISMYHIMISS